MGRKLIRIKQIEISPELIGQEADIILNTKEVFHGTVTSVEKGELILRSFHSHILTFETKNITEIIISK